MTLKELSQLTALKKELEKSAERIADFKYYSTTLNSFGLSPIGKSQPRNRIEENAIHLEAMEEKHGELKARYIEAYTALFEWIADIPDSRLRILFSLRFLDGLTWAEVAHKAGDGATKDAAKVHVTRYLDRGKIDDPDI